MPATDPIPPSETSSYLAGYKKWTSEASPALRRKLKKAGIDKALLEEDIEPLQRDNPAELDPAEWHCASHTPDIAAAVDTVADYLVEEFDLTPGQADGVAGLMSRLINAEAERRKSHLLGRLVAFFMRPGNVKLRVFGLAFACDLGALNGLKNQTAAAAKLHVSRAAVSVCTNEWSDLLDLPRSRHMKSQQTRDRFSADKKKSHWRHRGFTPKSQTARIA